MVHDQSINQSINQLVVELQKQPHLILYLGDCLIVFVVSLLSSRGRDPKHWAQRISDRLPTAEDPVC